MAEILEYFKDINFMYNDCSMYDTLSQMLVEFQAEIRAKAIDEFAEKLKEIGIQNNYHCSDCACEFCDGKCELCERGFEKEIDEIAEQLKESE